MITVETMIAAAPSGVQEFFNRLNSQTEVHVDDLFELARLIVAAYEMDVETAEDEIEAQLEEYFLDRDIPIDSGCSEGGEQIYRTNDD
jgi:cytosine/adenosine deaminase-related metal-dependent hydrolase